MFCVSPHGLDSELIITGDIVRCDVVVLQSGSGVYMGINYDEYKNFTCAIPKPSKGKLKSKGNHITDPKKTAYKPNGGSKSKENNRTHVRKDKNAYRNCQWCGQTFKETELSVHHITTIGSAGKKGDIPENRIELCGPRAAWGCHYEAQNNKITKEQLYRRRADLDGVLYEQIIEVVKEAIGRRPDVP